MNKLASSVLLLALCAAPAFAATAATYDNVSVVDVACSSKVAATADTHTRDCALKCAASGFGIVTKDQKFVKFDAAGNDKIVQALKASDKKDHLRVNVQGELDGSTLHVASIKLL